MTRNIHWQIGPYLIAEELQRNALTTLYRATDERDGQVVILHLLHQELSSEEAVVDAFLEAAKQSKRLQHKAIATVLDSGIGMVAQPSVGSSDAAQIAAAKPQQELESAPIVVGSQVVYLVTTDHPTQTLAEFLQTRTARLGINTSFHILRTVAAALHVAHEHRIVHGNINPASIYVEHQAVGARDFPTPVHSAEPTVFIADFYTTPVTLARHDLNPPNGQRSAPQPSARMQRYVTPHIEDRAKEHAEDRDASNHRTAEKGNELVAAKQLPTPVKSSSTDGADRMADSASIAGCRWPISPYMAPEQARDEEQIDTRTDIYSLGALAYLLLLGRPPFFGADLTFLLDQIANRLPTPPERVDDVVSPGIAYVLKAVLAKDAGTRYGSVQEFIGALEQGSRWVAANSATPNAAAADAPTAPPVRQRRQRRGALLVATLLSLVVLASAVVLTQNPLRTALLTGLAQNQGDTTDPSTQSNSSVDEADQNLTPVLMMTLTVSQVTPTPTGVIRIVGETTPGAAVAASQPGMSTTITLVPSLPLTDTITPTTTTVATTTVNTLNVGDNLSTTAVLSTTSDGAVIAALPVARSLTKTDENVNASALVDSTETPVPTATGEATQMATVAPTASRTNTPLPTATASETPVPTASATVKATQTSTPRPTATASNTAVPTATQTSTPRPTATASNTAIPTATPTGTPRPTATASNTAVPTATETSTPRPTATATLLLQPTATYTLVPTNTPLPTATNTALPTNTAIPTNTPRPTSTPLPTATNTPVPTATAIVGQVNLLEPVSGDSGGGQRTFRWQANFVPAPGTAFEMVFWKPEENPMVNGFGLSAPVLGDRVTVDLDALDDQLGSRLDNGQYVWGVLLVRTEPSYERIAYLGGGNQFYFTRGGSGGSSGGGPVSGE